ncbi:hypothetical protein HMPREF3190_00065 [Umbribacter vaginalis]|nr:hypothetical protein HMPREF3190_00065 [Coriobacteriales bacterium DNF00809]
MFPDFYLRIVFVQYIADVCYRVLSLRSANIQRITDVDYDARVAFR